MHTSTHAKMSALSERIVAEWLLDESVSLTQRTAKIAQATALGVDGADKLVQFVNVRAQQAKFAAANGVDKITDFEVADPVLVRAVVLQSPCKTASAPGTDRAHTRTTEAVYHDYYGAPPVFETRTKVASSPAHDPSRIRAANPAPPVTSPAERERLYKRACGAVEQLRGEVWHRLHVFRAAAEKVATNIKEARYDAAAADVLADCMGLCDADDGCSVWDGIVEHYPALGTIAHRKTAGVVLEHAYTRDLLAARDAWLALKTAHYAYEDLRARVPSPRDFYAEG